jgi:transcriptional regulator with XRE-family HTH domain
MQGMNEMAKDSTLHRVFIQNVVRRRDELGLTQGDMAERLNMSRPGYNQIERGVRCPSLDVVERVATALETTGSDLLQTSVPAGV